MTPQEIAVLTSLVTLLKEVGTWPILTIAIAVVLGPWLGMGLLTRSIEKRHAAVVEMYEANVSLVESYEKVATGLQDIIVLSTQTMTQVKDRVDNNLFCPLMRKDTKVEKQV